MSFFDELKRRNVFRVGAAYTVAAWLLLQITDVVVPILQLPDSVPRLILLLLFVGFVLALIFAWAYELTPEGVKREAEVDRAESVTRHTGRKLDFAIIALLAVAIVYLVIDNYVLDDPPGETAVVERSIAVLPFRNRSSLEQDSFFADGIHDDLLTQLSRVSSLQKVISRTSTEQYRDTTKPVRQIGEELGVANIVEGGVQRAGDQVRINVQLIDARTDEHVWAATYDRELTVDNLFGMQTEITREIVAALHGALSDNEAEALQSRPTSSLEAYEQYTMGRIELRKRTAASLARAKSHFEKAIELDPDYALAYVGLANVFAVMPEHAGAIRAELEAPRQRAVDKALMLDPTSGEAYANLANLRFRQGELDKAEEYFVKAIQLSPNYPTAYHWYGMLLRDNGRLEEALLQVRKAIELDPLGRSPLGVYGSILRRLGRPEEAKALFRSAIERDPQAPDHYSSTGLLLVYEGRLAEGLKWVREALRLNPGKFVYLRNTCYIRISLADYEGAEQCIDEFEAAFPHVSVRYRSLVQTYRGKLDKAISVLDNLEAKHPENSYPITRARILFAAGQSAAALTLLAKQFPDLAGNEDVQIDKRNVEDAVFVALALNDTGNKERADYLFDASLEVLETLHRVRGDAPVGLLDVYIHAARNDEKAAKAALREAFDMGWRLDIANLRLPPLEAWLSDPEWLAIVEQFEADLARQRQWYEEHKDDPLL